MEASLRVLRHTTNDYGEMYISTYHEDEGMTVIYPHELQLKKN